MQGKGCGNKDKAPTPAPTTPAPTEIPISENVLIVNYTLDADFELGTAMNVNFKNVSDQLQLDDTTNFDFIWVACSGRGTVVKVNTITGDILGEYYRGRGSTLTNWTIARSTLLYLC